MANKKILEITDLHVRFDTRQGSVRAVDGLTFDVAAGETLGIVGESGCGKSMTARAIMRLVPNPGQITQGKIGYYPDGGNGKRCELTTLDPDGENIRQIRGKEIAMIFQEPMVSFSPVHTIGDQIAEIILLHQNVDKKEAREQAIDRLHVVGIPNPKQRFDSYPFELSGGMRQRAMIAMALACEPKLLIADEPTTALDVTVQAQILDLLERLQGELGMAIMLITHNLGVVATMARRMVVMYLGQVVEEGSAEQIFDEPKHPYTWGLMKSVPTLGQSNKIKRLSTIKGTVPGPYTRLSGCPFHPRCPEFMPGLCDQEVPDLVQTNSSQKVRCLLYDKDHPRKSAQGRVRNA